MTKAPDPFEIMEQRGEQAKQSAAEAELERERADAERILGSLIQPDKYLGETLRMDFRTVTVQVHDHYRWKVGGIPHLSYLVASRIQPWKTPIDWADEDASVLLLRVLGAAPTPSDMLDNIVRAEAARRATGNEANHWETQEYMDGYTRHQLSFAGLTCEVVGTFSLGRHRDAPGGTFELRFGTDINNFYPNKGLKVYKPVGEALREIMNFRDPSLTPDHALKNYTVPIGNVRYASTNPPMQGVDEVDVWIAPMDLLAQRTALFGMSRTGKSNTTKIVARAIYNLRRAEDAPIKVGQIIFDYNGEYANENTQGSDNVEANALKNVWREQGGSTNDVVTYGFTQPKNDPTRKQLRINAFGNDVPSADWVKQQELSQHLDMLLVGKQIIDDLLIDQNSIYIRNFIKVDLSIPDTVSDYGTSKRYQRTVLAYRALLAKASLTPPAGLLPYTAKLFNPKLLEKMRNSPNESARPRYKLAANLLDNTVTNKPLWSQIANALETLAEFIND